jgi:UDP-N-acetylmuramoyl-tripeptide--D-alanyl-D-alanine ligase
MKRWDAPQIAHNAGARLLHAPNAPTGAQARDGSGTGPDRAVIGSADAGPGTLFVGLAGERVHGGTYAVQALENGAWGVLTSPEHAQAAVAAARERESGSDAVVIAADDPLVSLQRLAHAWRRELGCQVIGVTGSTGKTSTKDLLSALLAPHRRAVVTQANYNTEIGLPLQILMAPEETEVMVLEMGMRGKGQIAELAAIAAPDVAVIVSIGPVHLEMLGTIENIAAAKAELLEALPAGGIAVLPVDEPLLAPHLREDLRNVTFGAGGDVSYAAERDHTVEIDLAGEHITLEVNFAQAHMRSNLLAAVAAAKAVGVTPSGRVELTLTPGRGQLLQLRNDISLLDGSYNGNPTSMRAALTELDLTARQRAAGGNAHARRVAVLGDMLELGPDGPDFHHQVGAFAADHADVLVTVGPLAAKMNSEFNGDSHHVDNAQEAAALLVTLLRAGDVVLVKGSLGVGLKYVSDALIAGSGT